VALLKNDWIMRALTLQMGDSTDEFIQNELLVPDWRREATGSMTLKGRFFFFLWWWWWQ
jgi:hypothetical protein